MNDTPKDSDSTIQTLKRLARKSVDAENPTPENAPVPELTLFRVPSTRQHLIELGGFTPEEIEVLDRMAEAQADREAEKTADQTRTRFVSGLRLESDLPEKTPKKTEDGNPSS